MFSAGRRLRSGNEFGGLSASQIVQFYTLNIDSNDIFENANTRQMQHEQDHAEDEDELVTPLQTRTQPQQNVADPRLVPLKDLAQAPVLILPPRRHRPAYQPDFTLSAKERRKEKSKLRNRILRDDKRRATQQEKGSGLKGCVTNRSPPIPLLTSFQRPQGIWTGARTEACYQDYRLMQTLNMGLRLVAWEGSQTKIIEDMTHLPLVVMGARPNDDTWMDTVRRIDDVFTDAHKHLHMKQEVHRRGRHLSVPMGNGFGGGQQQPSNFAHTAHNAAVLQRVLDDSDVRRAAGLCDHYLESYFPQIHSLYKNVLNILHADDPELKRIFPNSVFAAANINFECAVTFRHVDFLNLLFGLCAVFPTGNYDHTKGGHLVLWDLGLVLEFPPGTVILLPSALLEHSNIMIGKHETRQSITFYSSSGLFRWCHNGRMSDKEFKSRASAKLREKWENHRLDLWKTGIELLRPVP